MNRFIIFTFILFIMCSCNKSNTPQLAQIGAVQIVTVGINNAVVTNTIVSTGNSTLLAKGLCWSSSTALPTIENSPFSIGSIANGGSNDTLKGLIYNSKYYIRAYATNQIGTSYSAVDFFSTLPSKYSLGETAEGGNVLYIDSTGEHGLIAARSIYVASRRWADDVWTKLGVTQYGYGTGLSNTINIINAGNIGNGTAAVYCNNLVADGYDDWFLPSIEEMWLFRTNLTFTQWLSYPWNIYWTSSEASGHEAFFVVIGGFASYDRETKDESYSVLPMRRY